MTPESLYKTARRHQQIKGYSTLNHALLSRMRREFNSVVPLQHSNDEWRRYHIRAGVRVVAALVFLYTVLGISE